jgi:hypothetical protein
VARTSYPRPASSPGVSLGRGFPSYAGSSHPHTVWFRRGTYLGEVQALPELPSWNDLPGVKSGHVWAVDANSYFSRLVLRLIEGVGILACILHPQALPDSPRAKGVVRFAVSAAHH